MVVVASAGTTLAARRPVLKPDMASGPQ